MKKSDLNKIEQAASNSIKEILLDKKLSIHGLTKLINKGGHSVSHPTTGTWVFSPLRMSYYDGIVLAKALGITTEKLDNIIRGKK